MAIGTQVSPVQTLVTFCLWAQRSGFSVDEMHGFSRVHDVHAPGSWHYDQEKGFGKGMDLNWRRPNSSERRKLTGASAFAIELGLGVIFARDGSVGPASHHQDHAHVDVGTYSNLGKGDGRARGGGDVLTERLQRVVRATPDQVWGRDTHKRLEAVRAASLLKGTTFPHGIAYTRRVLGLPAGDVWDARSRDAHDAAVRKVQVALARLGYFGGPASGVWSAPLDAAYVKARDRRRRL